MSISIIVILPILLIISFLWALWSLKKETSRMKEVDHTKKDLLKEKILYKAFPTDPSRAEKREREYIALRNSSSTVKNKYVSI